MKKDLLMSVFSLLVATAVFAVPNAAAAPEGAGAVASAIAKAVANQKPDLTHLKQAVITSSAVAKNEIARMKEPNFSWAFQSLVKVMEAYQELRQVSPAAAVAVSAEVNAPFKAGWGETLTVTQLINRESIVLYGSLQDEFNAWGAQLAQDQAAALKSPAARAVLSRLASSRSYIAKAKDYNASFILQSLTGVMDAHNALRKNNPALAALLSQEINKPIKTGFGGADLVVSRFVNMESVNVYGSLQYELDAWAQAIEKDLK